MGVQETRMTQFDVFKIHSMQGNYMFDFASSCARGNLGGILSIWGPNVFVQDSVECTNNVIIVGGVWLAVSIHCYMVNVYASRDLVGKQQVLD